MSSKKPTIKRILKEASELANQPSADYHAAPLETDLFEWHFTLRGPPAPSPFAGGIYHGRIVLPPAYPLKPPSFRFLTPSGRFEVNREICLSISGFHEETWQPAWGIRTALVAIRSFMDTEAAGQVGGMDGSDELRRRLAAQSRAAACAGCGGRSNELIMHEQAAAVERLGADAAAAPADEAVPGELRLAYREELGAQPRPAPETTRKAPGETAAAAGRAGLETPSTAAPTAAAAPAASTAVPDVAPMGQQQQRIQQEVQSGVPDWVDKAIYGILGMLVFMLFRKLIF